MLKESGLIEIPLCLSLRITKPHHKMLFNILSLDVKLNGNRMLESCIISHHWIISTKIKGKLVIFQRWRVFNFSCFSISSLECFFICEAVHSYCTWRMKSFTSRRTTSCMEGLDIWSKQRVISGIRCSATQSPIHFLHGWSQVTGNWGSSNAWMDMKVSWLSHQYKRTNRVRNIWLKSQRYKPVQAI